MLHRRRKYRLITAGLALGVAAATFFLARGPSTVETPDILIITIDTLRADRIGVYGHDKAQTPNIDALAKSGIRFDNATTPFPRTTPALASMMTGLWPQNHGSREVGKKWRNGLALAEVLKKAGYVTVGLSANTLASKREGFDKGFDFFVVPEKKKADRVTDKAIETLRAQPRDTPLFMWVHYMDPHFPYRPPGRRYRKNRCNKLSRNLRNGTLSKGAMFVNGDGQSAKALDGCSKLYDAEITFADEHVGRLVQDFKSRRSDPLLVFTSDHGENLGEGGLYFEHGPNVHDASLRIPMLISGPGVVRDRVETAPFRLEDLMPTLLGHARVEKSRWPAMDGLDLSSRLSANEPTPSDAGPIALAESGSAMHVEMTAWISAGRQRGMHCFHDQTFSRCTFADEPAQFFDRQADPKLEAPLQEVPPDVQARLEAAPEIWKPEYVRQRTARTARFKLVDAPKLEGGYTRTLYDLHADRSETRDVSAQHADVVQRLGRALDAWTPSLAPPEEQPLSEQTEAALRALGYIE